MKHELWHAKPNENGRMWDPMFRDLDGDRVWPEDYILVGVVNVSDLDEAFEAGNSIDAAWYEGHRVVWADQARSLSVGDVILLLSDDRYPVMVDSFGFKVLNQGKKND